MKVEPVFDERIRMYVHARDNVEIFYDEGFMVNDCEDHVSIFHEKEDYFRIVVPYTELIFDFVMTTIIDFNGRKNKLGCEIGLDETSTGFASHLFPSDKPNTIFCLVYSDEEKYGSNEK